MTLRTAVAGRVALANGVDLPNICKNVQLDRIVTSEIQTRSEPGAPVVFLQSGLEWLRLALGMF